MTTPCLKRLDADCFNAQPRWAKRAFAYRLVHLLTPKPLTKRLPKSLRLALIAPGVEIPPGVEMPPGVVVSPGAEVPPAWNPGDPPPPGVTIQPGAFFPAGWSPDDPLPEGVVLDPGAEIPAGWTPPDPLPSGAIDPPALPPDVQDTGPIAPLYTAPGEPGPTKPPPAPAAGPAWTQHFTIADWTAGANATWTGTTWSFSLALSFFNGIIFVRAGSGWAPAYRPTAIRITYTGPAITLLNVRDSLNNDFTVPAGAAYTSGTERTLTFSPDNDINSILIRCTGGTVVFTNIEFYAA